ncbi:GNAT family N-acetyltransferase [Enemella dayhoffiae]|uniref:GNAT family N-acetyltransferase n=1 Tax=Enemella dayhoffiae TaxID=2016507 RepID=UPI001E3CDF1C|nr:GNAT family N-acetyltransferase [Enemella dayhoffiae]
MPELNIRDARASDAAAIAATYAPYTTETAITFEDRPCPPQEMAERIAAAQQAHAFLVAELDGQILGHAYAGPFRGRFAWQWSTEVSVYLRRGLRRAGAGKALYAALLQRLTERGYVVAIASIALPNEASIGLHRHFGFTDLGVAEMAGWKLGRWHDVLFLQKRLTEGYADPEPPR